jgi:DNA-binding GntR family transcriptional regulator
VKRSRQPLLTKADSVAEILREEIRSGRLTAGAQLLQNAVAQQIGVSSTPVREAFSILEAEGFLKRRAHHGVIVAHRDYSEVADLYEIRLALETLALRRTLGHAAGGVSAELIKELKRILATAKRALLRPDIHAFRGANAQFHEALARHCGSRALAEHIHLLVSRSLFVATLDEARMARTQREHEALVETLKRGHGERAIRALAKHIQRTVDELRKASLQGGATARRHPKPPID